MKIGILFANLFMKLNNLEGIMSVKVYTTPSCGYCQMLKSYLKQKNVSYTEYNVAVDTNKAMEMVRKSGQQGVPVTDINGHVVVGFDKQRIDSYLN